MAYTFLDIKSVATVLLSNGGGGGGGGSILSDNVSTDENILSSYTTCKQSHSI